MSDDTINLPYLKSSYLWTDFKNDVVVEPSRITSRPFFAVKNSHDEDDGRTVPTNITTTLPRSKLRIDRSIQRSSQVSPMNPALSSQIGTHFPIVFKEGSLTSLSDVRWASISQRDFDAPYNSCSFQNPSFILDEIPKNEIPNRHNSRHSTAVWATLICLLCAALIVVPIGLYFGRNTGKTSSQVVSTSSTTTSSTTTTTDTTTTTTTTTTVTTTTTTTTTTTVTTTTTTITTTTTTTTTTVTTTTTTTTTTTVSTTTTTTTSTTATTTTTTTTTTVTTTTTTTTTTIGCGSSRQSALLLSDTNTATVQTLVDSLQSAGLTVNYISGGITNYTGSPSANTYGAVILITGNAYATDMPTSGQQSIVDAQQYSGTGVVITEWGAYQVSTSRWSILSSLLLALRTTGSTGIMSFTSDNSGHPIWNGLATSFSSSPTLGCSGLGTPTSGSATIANCTLCTGPGVIVRPCSAPAGRIVQIAHAGHYSLAQFNWGNDANILTMMINAVQWAAQLI